MTVLDFSFSSPEDNILFDEVLLSLAEEGVQSEILRFWESPEVFIVLGKGGRWEKDIKAEAVRKDAIPVLQRVSGGGTVLQGPGCLNYTLILDKQKAPSLNTIKGSYQFILSRMTLLSKVADSVVQFLPISDLVLGQEQKKFSGNAQRRARRYILHHGTILYQFDIAKIERYLTMPADMPAYRNGRSHKDFLTNIPAQKEDIKGIIKEAFGASGKNRYWLTVTEEERLKRYQTEKKVRIAIF